MTSQPGKQTIPIHILPNIPRNKSNQKQIISNSLKHIQHNFLKSESLTFPVQTLFVNFEQISHIGFVFLLFTLNKQIQAKKTGPQFLLLLLLKYFL